MKVFPTHVGVFLPQNVGRAILRGLPHARGGVSGAKHISACAMWSSPRTWGCFCVMPSKDFKRSGLPHARGGVSLVRSASSAAARSSPRTWGCFCRSASGDKFGSVFPTHVGVFPTRDTSRLFLRGSSPRTWGCFFFHIRDVLAQYVFPTHVGVFLRHKATREQPSRLPHARGGVSYRCSACWEKLRSSPRTWGCFPLSRGFFIKVIVFPTHVGVFLSHKKERKRLDKSSPRTWGCFSTVPTITAFPIVFPTHVGVFLC